MFQIAFLIISLLFVPTLANAQRGGGQRAAVPPPNAKAVAPIDLTGYWVSVVTEDWRWRMITPEKGSYPSIPLNAEGRQVANAWDPAKDEAEGNECKAYGAGNIMRMPTRVHITWDNDNTLRLETDAGMQTRLFQFGESKPPAGPPTWQGYSVASWEYGGFGRSNPATPNLNMLGKPRGGSLKVVTTHLRAGYLQKNGVPYGERAVVTEYFTVPKPTPNGDQWLIVTTIVDDPQYLGVQPSGGSEFGPLFGPLVRTTNFKRLRDASGWNPTPCSAR
jgi:hypothetical protein